MKTILVPVDFSTCSREGLRYAIAFANEFGAKLILLHATYLGYIYSCEGTAIYDIPACKRLQGKLPSAKCAISCAPWTSEPSNLKRPLRMDRLSLISAPLQKITMSI